MTTVSGRGNHYIFLSLANAPLGNWFDALGARDKHTGYKPGHNGAGDLRYGRGAVVAAPLIHRSGRRYGTYPAPIAPLPGAVVRHIFAARRARGLPIAHTWTSDPAHKGKQPSLSSM